MVKRIKRLYVESIPVIAEETTFINIHQAPDGEFMAVVERPYDHTYETLTIKDYSLTNLYIQLANEGAL